MVEIMIEHRDNIKEMRLSTISEPFQFNKTALIFLSLPKPSPRHTQTSRRHCSTVATALDFQLISCICGTLS
jgi:hypothetical protein